MLRVLLAALLAVSPVANAAVMPTSTPITQAANDTRYVVKPSTGTTQTVNNALTLTAGLTVTGTTTFNSAVTMSSGFTSNAAGTVTTGAGITSLTLNDSVAENNGAIVNIQRAGANILQIGFNNNSSGTGPTFVAPNGAGALEFSSGTNKLGLDTNGSDINFSTGTSSFAYKGNNVNSSPTLQSNAAAGANTGFTFNASNGPNTLLVVQNAGTNKMTLDSGGKLSVADRYAVTGGGAVLFQTGGSTAIASYLNSSGVTQATLGTAGTWTLYNAETAVGVGSPYERGSTAQKAETGADTNVLTVTPAAAAGRYRISISIQVSAQNTATLGWTATWTDSNGSAQAPTNLSLNQTGVAAPALTFTAATNGNYWAEYTVDVNNAGTNIVIKTTFSGTSIAYNISATVERVQ